MFPRAFPRSFPQRSSTQRSDCLSDSCTPPILVLHPVCLLHLDLNLLEDLIFLMPQTAAPRDKDHKTQEQEGCAVEQVVTRVGRGRWQEDGESHPSSSLSLGSSRLAVPWIVGSGQVLFGIVLVPHIRIPWLSICSGGPAGHPPHDPFWPHRRGLGPLAPGREEGPQVRKWLRMRIT